MSNKPPGQGKDQGKGQDKKKKFAPPTENELAKQQYMELDEEEIEHRRQLDMKYRDRARERREGVMEGEEQGSDNENPVAEDGDEEYQTVTKGLDLDLFIKQKEKERAELLAAKGESGKMQVENAEEKNKKITAKTNLGLGIQRVLFKDSSKRDGQRNIFKSGNCYEFDLDLNFGSNLPSIVIRSRDKNLEEETPVSIEISDRIHQKLGQIMTWMKTGKKPEVAKGPDVAEFHKAMAAKAHHPVSKPHLSDASDDEDDIFPDAKKKLKTENGPKLPVATVDERNQVVMKGLFSSLKQHGDDQIEIEPEDQTAVYNKMIQEKNKKLIAELAQKRAEEKLAKLQQQDDYYTECFPEEIPELEALKESQKRADQSRKSAKSKKKALGKQVEQVTKIMDEKRKGRGGE